MCTTVLRRSMAVVTAAFLAIVWSATTAGAHVTVSPGDAPAGGYRTVELSVPHGCGEAPTEELAVALTQDIQSVKAEAVPGWSVSYEIAELDEPYDNHGTTITDYVASITWTTNGDALPGDQYMTFGISARWPDAPGEQVLLPAVQRCTDGSESAWIDPDPDSELPAPAVVLTAAAGGHDDAGAAGDDGDDGDDGASTTLVVASLVVAIAALLLAGFAVVTARRT